MLLAAAAIVIAGQSNALGQAALTSDSDHIINVQVMRRSGFIVDSTEPLGGAGYGYGRALARSYMARHSEIDTLWLLQCAVSGTTISLWKPGSTEAYDVCRVMIHQAQNFGLNVVAVTWLQGEADAKLGTPNYDVQLTNIINAFRTDIGATVPFVAGELGKFLSGTVYIYRARIVNLTKNAINAGTKCGFATSEGLTDKGDGLHFDHNSQDIMGTRIDSILEGLE